VHQQLLSAEGAEYPLVPNVTLVVWNAVPFKQFQQFFFKRLLAVMIFLIKDVNG